MSAPPSSSTKLSRADFEQLVAEHEEIIRLANQLEYQLYRLGAAQDGDRVSECQQAGGALIGHLRGMLFRYDQQILPILEASLADDLGENDRTGQAAQLPATA
jgi:hypothetical protein